ncbi:MAG: hypothetical protein ACOX5J_14805, partial [Candidatus Hydrogenedentales bacterium]
TMRIPGTGFSMKPSSRRCQRPLAQAPALGAAAAMEEAEALLKLAETKPVKKDWRQRIEELCVAMFDSIGYQTSVPRFQARNGERGAILDYVDRPLNNRWWLEDEFERIREFATEEEKLARLEVIRTWESPGHGSYYDDLGNVAQMDHVALPAGPWVEPDLVEIRNPHFPWTDNGFSRARLSWLCLMRWPEKLTYRGLDPEGDYFLRATGRGDYGRSWTGSPWCPQPIPANKAHSKNSRFRRNCLPTARLSLRSGISMNTISTGGSGRTSRKSGS